jgi:hypothetical protein
MEDVNDVEVVVDPQIHDIFYYSKLDLEITH